MVGLRAILLLLNMLLLEVTSLGAFAQEILKHPRVVELEDHLKDSASEYVRARFPEIPFMVQVRIDPVRRESAKANSKRSDDGLLFGYDESEEIVDEWDNPQVPLKALINRVHRIRIVIQLPMKVKETEINELREGVFAILHLTSARDEVEIQRKEWDLSEFPLNLLYVIAGAVVLMLLGQLVINVTSANRIAKAIKSFKPTDPQRRDQGSLLASSFQSNGYSESHDSRDISGTKDVIFNDPIKINELVAHYLKQLVVDPGFPNYHDIFLLEKFGKDHPGPLGAILREFPSKIRATLLNYCPGYHWIDAIKMIGHIDYDCLEILKTMTQFPRDVNMNWSRAILSVWRLDNRRDFIKSLGKDEAFALLAQMPRAISLEEAMRCFPGSWAEMIDNSFKPKRITEERLREIHGLALQSKPLCDSETIRKHTLEMDLLGFLRTATLTDERNIYTTLPAQSIIHEMRAPFYIILEQPAEVLSSFVFSVSIDLWALSLFNVSKAERAIILRSLGEKQQFLVNEKFKEYDRHHPDESQVGTAREQIAVQFKNYLKEKSAAEDSQAMVDSILEGTDGLDEVA